LRSREQAAKPTYRLDEGPPETARKVDERAPEIEKQAKTVVDD